MTSPVALASIALPSEVAVATHQTTAVSQTMPRVGTPLLGLNVLVVEDDEDTRDMLVECLTSNGAQTFAAPNGTAGFEILGAEPVDVIVTDVAMPGEDGISMIRRARRELPVRDVPCVVLSGNARREDASGIEGAPVEFFRKPADIFAVVRAVGALARRERDAACG